MRRRDFSVALMVSVCLLVFGFTQAFAQCNGTVCAVPGILHRGDVVVQNGSSTVIHDHGLFFDRNTVISQSADPCCPCNTQTTVVRDRAVLPDTFTTTSVGPSGMYVTSGSIAQQKAEALARSGRFTHKVAGFGLAGRYEGIGFSTRSADEAIRSCCYWGRRTPVAIGVAHGVRGWVAVVGYN